MSALLYKQQADSLAKHFSEFHKITLNDIHALEAVKAIHGRSTSSCA
jgi:hypothetical protein